MQGRCNTVKSRNIIEEYHKYRDQIGNRKELYRMVAKRYDIASALYPGSHIDITPSLVIPKVIYVDNFKGAISFFKSMELIKKYIFENKEYEEPCDIVFKGQDYTRELNIEPVDLVKVKEKMKGPKYKLTAENYLFRKK